jgi:pimeloyl-ACP methyl ester carboxylesterase
VTQLSASVLAIGGEGALGQVVPDQARAYAKDVTGVVLPCGHWVAEGAPGALLEHLLPFLA